MQKLSIHAKKHHNSAQKLPFLGMFPVVPIHFESTYRISVHGLDHE